MLSAKQFGKHGLAFQPLRNREVHWNETGRNADFQSPHLPHSSSTKKELFSTVNPRRLSEQIWYKLYYAICLVCYALGQNSAHRARTISYWKTLTCDRAKTHSKVCVCVWGTTIEMPADFNTDVIIQWEAVAIQYILVKLQFSIFHPMSIHLSPCFNFKFKRIIFVL